MKTKKERLPVYQNIKNEMREWIQTGIWKQGGLIPVEASACQRIWLCLCNCKSCLAGIGAKRNP